MKLPRTRNRLEWSRLTHNDNGGWDLTLPDLYARLFERMEPLLMQKCSGGWRDTADYSGLQAHFVDLSDNDLVTARRFLSDFGRFIILGRGRHLQSHFTDELDCCVALDYNAESPSELAQHRRTPIGQLEYRAKYEQSERAVAVIAEHMTALYKRIGGVVPSTPYYLTYIPSAVQKQFDLPRELAHALAKRLSACQGKATPPRLLRPKLVGGKPPLKELPLVDKIACWRSLQQSGAISLSDSVVDRTVIVVDDLYQSGSTIWSYAAYLKAAGAAAAIGMVCVKSCRDTDNL